MPRKRKHNRPITGSFKAANRNNMSSPALQFGGQALKDDNEDFIAKALRRFKTCMDGEADFRRQSREDLFFYDGNQWDVQTMQDRQNSGRPCLTFNHIPPFIQQVINDLRDNRPMIQVDPISNKSDEDTAEVLSGLIKHIENESNADQQYDKAAWYQTTTGLGYLRIIPKYEDENSFNQILRIEAIQNPECVFFDPFATQSDGSDAEYAFIIDDLSYEDYVNKYPDSNLAQTMTLQGGNYSMNTAKGNLTELLAGPGWTTSNTIRVAEYYYKDYKYETLYRVLDNRTGITEDTFDKPQKIDLASLDIKDDGPGSTNEVFPSIPAKTIVMKREVKKTTIKWVKLNGEEILEETEFPGEFIPLVPVKGEEYFIDGKKILSGMIKNMKDAQKSYNFHTNLQMEVVEMAPKAPWIVAKGQIDGYEQVWRDSNVINYTYLPYNPIANVGGTTIPLPPPTRNSSDAPIQAIAMTRQMAADDLKAITGIYDPSLGAEGNEISGKAILARQHQAKIGNMHYYDNLCRSIKHIGRIIVRVIPHYYDTPRMIRIIKPDNTSEMAAINGYAAHAETPAGQGNIKSHDLINGEYDVVLDTGPTYATKRQEAVESMLELAAADPNALPMFADIMVGNMDWPGAREIAKRLKTQVPPQVLQATEGGSDPQAQITQMSQQLQQFQDQLQKATAFGQVLHQKLQEATDENKLLKTKTQIELAKATNDTTIKDRSLQLDAHKVKLEYLIKNRELHLEEEQLKLEKAKLGIDALAEMNDMAEKVHDKHVEHMDRAHDRSLEIDFGGNDDSDTKPDNLSKDITDNSKSGISSNTL